MAYTGHMHAITIGSTVKAFSDWAEFRFSVGPLKERLFEVNLTIFSLDLRLEYLQETDAEVERVLTLLEADL